MGKEYSTILVLVLAFVGLYIFSNKIIFLYLSLGIGIVSVLLPRIAEGIHFLWMKLSLLMGSVSAVLILALVFFIFIIPLSFLAKLMGKKFIIMRRREGSYFRERNFMYDKESIGDVW